ncbi:ABATE domain-containing protein [Herbiconiux sp. P17]|uniref:CGNR zinc finger domain-containing protein n=1 Tax=Herbiconiux wuyangfengii TaxID=3342794 RepID=UPI0035BB00A1
MEHSFPCGTLSLDFVGTLKARRNITPRDVLTTPWSLDAWFEQSGLVDDGIASRPADVDEAVHLREAIYSLVASRLHDEEYDEHALEVLNRTAEAPPVVPRLAASGRRTEATPDQALSSVARDAIEVLSGPDAALLKECGRPECTQVYLDRSRGGRREWCAMETCGNKMKAAAYRARKKAEALV